MTNTELALLAVYGAAVPLEEICLPYFGLSYPEARRLAATNDLPVPTFRARASAKAPLLIHTAVFAKYIDETAEQQEMEWNRSQV